MKAQELLMPTDLKEVCKQFNTASFIHIPKTGGSYSLKDQTRSPGHRNNGQNIFHCLGHVCCLEPTTDRLNHLWPIHRMKNTSCLEMEQFKNSFVFAMVRNPFDMLVSYYHHDDCSGWEGCRYDAARSYMKGSPYDFSTFESFIRAYCDDGYGWHKPALKDFLFFQIFHNSGKSMIPFVGKFEYMDICCNIFSKLVYGDDKIYMIQDAKNTGSAKPKKNYKDYYTPEMVRLVERKCRRELDLFGYSFHGSDRRAIIDVRDVRYKNKFL